MIEKGASKYEPVQQNMKDFLSLVIHSHAAELQGPAKERRQGDGQENGSGIGGSMFGWNSTNHSGINGQYLKNPSVYSLDR